MVDDITHPSLVAGGSGLIGRALLEVLSRGGRHRPIHALTRRPLDGLPAGVTPLVREDLVALDELPRVDDVFVALGTTIKAAGSREAFTRVDHDMVLSVATRAREAGARRCFVVTAMGADAGSSIFYNQVKGRTEDDLRGLGYDALWIFRPSLLTGDRAESRPGEKVANFLGRGARHLMIGPLRKYRPIAGETVARAMVASADDAAARGTRVVLSDEIERLGA